MENNQSKQQSSELGDSKLVRSSRRAPSDNLNSLLMLFKHWNWLTWVGAWVLLVAITAISILSLVYPISLSPEPEPKTAAAENPTETSSQTGSPLLWVVGAAVTFTAGSLVIFKWLSSSSHSGIRRRSSKRSLTRRQQRKILLQGHSSSPTQPELLSPTALMPVEIEPVVMLPLEESHLVDSGDESLAQMLGDRPPLSALDLTADNCLNAESEPVVTVLPPEESTLVDSEEESLAEMMDIRRHRSLASILQNFKV